MHLISKFLKVSTFLLIAFFIAILAFTIAGKKNKTNNVSPLIGKPFPDYELDLFNGNKLNIKNLKGNVLLINFWASWCAPCKDEFPALEASWLKHKNNNVVFLGINILDDKNHAIQYLNTFRSNYQNAIDKNGSIAVDLGVAGVPETYFVNDKGIIIDKYIGPLTEELIDYYIVKTKSTNG